MDSHTSPSISSFVIRFVVSEASEAAMEMVPHPYRGAIRHIQSEEEINFSSWDDAVAFIRRYVPLENPARDETP